LKAAKINYSATETPHFQSDQLVINKKSADKKKDEPEWKIEPLLITAPTAVCIERTPGAEKLHRLAI